MGSRGVSPTVWAKEDANSVEVRKAELRSLRRPAR
jgi:hypothetical protein